MFFVVFIVLVRLLLGALGLDAYVWVLLGGVVYLCGCYLFAGGCVFTLLCVLVLYFGCWFVV